MPDPALSDTSYLPGPAPRPACIVVLHNVVDEVIKGEQTDLVADQEVMHTAHDIAESLHSRGYQVDVLPVRTLDEIRAGLQGYARATTLVFNLVEGLSAGAADEPRIPRLLEAMKFRYTGSAPTTLATCLDKARTKRILLSRGVPTAPFQVCRTAHVSVRVPLPAIVKPVAEDASLGITPASVVRSRDEMQRQVAYILAAYRQPALVEAFVSGREFNVGVWGNGTPAALPLAELEFGDWPEYERICHFIAKWDEDSVDYVVTTPRCPADVEPELAEAIRQVAVQAYEIMGCNDYARVDMRIRDGVPYVLEVNPNPCIARDAGFARAAGVAGYDYAAMLEQIVQWAWARPPCVRARRAPRS